ncbi:hypothetical protein [Embleya scabrispora]|uniref:hypothetical protein n=1 Tax=Embleya scabrispora TaxID=159449 RepID=UPI0003724901|nr:hypothetical protein [Embleya scabrispora]MYS86464.1 hypothetical protein [Streptomyces sp. SID5474]
MIPSTVQTMATWSNWVALADADAPRLLGVYLAKQGPGGRLVYVGSGGERRGKGIRGRLEVYASLGGLATGLGRAVFDHALADLDWVRERTARIEAGHPEPALEWGRAAMEWADVHICWTNTEDEAAARHLEKRIIRTLDGSGLWNR